MRRLLTNLVKLDIPQLHALHSSLKKLFAPEVKDPQAANGTSESSQYFRIMALVRKVIRDKKAAAQLQRDEELRVEQFDPVTVSFDGKMLKKRWTIEPFAKLLLGYCKNLLLR